MEKQMRKNENNYQKFIPKKNHICKFLNNVETVTRPGLYDAQT